MKTEYPNVLILTRNAWNDGNCSGNTLSNFFGDWPKDRLANAFFRAENIENDVCQTYFCVTEQDIIKSILGKNKSVGRVVSYQNKTLADISVLAECDIVQSKNIYGFFAHHRWTVALWLRDFLWGIGRWKNDSFDDFLYNFKPEVIFMPCYDSVYMHRILWYVRKKTNARIVLFTGDDTYTLHQVSYSPLYWINRFINRHTMKKSVDMADTLFVISDLQKQEYDKIFKRDCVILRKGRDFNDLCQPKEIPNHPIRLVYTGNIHAGRWKTLAYLAQAVKKINANGQKMILDIYSLSAKSEKIISALNIDGASKTMPPASNVEIHEALSDADILVFVEPFDKKERLKWRLSFSTKIVDYLASSRPILAIGPKDLSSMNYLMQNDAAFCITDVDNLKEQLLRIVNNTNLLHEYVIKAWNCGKQNNSSEQVRYTLFQVLTGNNHDS